MYKKYSHLYKFHNSYDLLKYEKRFKYMLRFDISKCFYNIYSHSISWAIKDKIFAKLNKSEYSFESQFDKLMQKINFRETNGIVVGPELSRIFAEIILQRIDVEVFKCLIEKNLLNRKDYVIARYIDDYYVFSNDMDLNDKIQSMFKFYLEDYGLYINEKKTIVFSRPFLTNISIAKIEINRILKENFAEKGIKYIGIANQIKSICKKNEVQFSSISTFTINRIRTEVKKECLRRKEGEVENLKRIGCLIDLAFYLYAMDRRARSTYLVLWIIEYCCEAEYKEAETKAIVLDQIYRNLIEILNIASSDIEESQTEYLDILIGLKRLGKEYTISKELLFSLFPYKKDIANMDLGKMNYFQITTLLYVIEDDGKYANIKKVIEQELPEKFSRSSFIERDTELAYLFYDCLSCPYLSLGVKKEIIDRYLSSGHGTIKDQTKDRLIKFFKYNSMCINWKKEYDLGERLKKKELHVAY